MYILWISEQTALNLLYIINLYGLVTQTVCVYWVAQTESLYVNQDNISVYSVTRHCSYSYCTYLEPHSPTAYKSTNLCFTLNCIAKMPCISHCCHRQPMPCKLLTDSTYKLFEVLQTPWLWPTCTRFAVS